MTLAFIVRVEMDGPRWAVTLQDLETGERRGFDGLDACCVALQERVRARAPARARARARPRASSGGAPTR